MTPERYARLNELLDRAEGRTAPEWPAPPSSELRLNEAHPLAPAKRPVPPVNQ